MLGKVALTAGLTLIISFIVGCIVEADRGQDNLIYVLACWGLLISFLVCMACLYLWIWIIL